MNLNATNSQWVAIDARLGCCISGATGGLSNFTTGEGAYTYLLGSGTSGDGAQARALGGNSAAIDTTVAMAVALTVINPTATATCETKLIGALLELI
jgi:hypothetical protein